MSRSPIQEIIEHARQRHDGRFFIIGLHRGFQAGFGNPDTAQAKAAPVLNTLDDALDFMLEGPCGCEEVGHD